MLRYCLKRLWRICPVALGVLVVVASLIHIVPGDPASLILGDFASLEDKRELEKQLGLDQSFATQLLRYLTQLAHLDLGQSLIYQRPVASLMLERLLPTLELAFLAILLALLISVPLGTLAAVYQGRWVDRVAMFFAVFGASMPNFWLGPLLVILFSLKLNLFPVSERSDWSSYVLPTLTLALGLSSILSRICRNAVLETIHEEYIRTARMKGASERLVLMRHVAKNAALPMVTVLGLQFGVLLTGAIITEKIFDWPGLGSLIVDALNQRDYPLVQGCVLLFSLSYIVVNFLTDLAYAVLDPRISLR